MFKTLYNELNERAQLLENESKLINREIELLNPTTISQKNDNPVQISNPVQVKETIPQQIVSTNNSSELNNSNSESSLMDYLNMSSNNNQNNNPLNNKQNNNPLNTNVVAPKSFMESVRLFFKTDLYFFMKYYLYFMILISICFYILIFLNKNAKDGLIIMENKILFYIGIVCLFILINDILETPMESLKKFVLVIIITLLIVYIVNYFIVETIPSKRLKGHFGTVLWTTLIVYLASVFCIYYMFHRKDKAIAIDLYNAFNYSINKNLTILIFLTIYLYVYVSAFKKLNRNTSFTDMLRPMILGVLVMFLLFCILIYIGYKLKIINRINILNSFISFFAIFIFIVIFTLKLSMDSLKQVCTENISIDSIREKERIILLIFVALFIIWWLEDDRIWSRWSSMAFIFASVMAFYSMFVLSAIYPDIGIFSFWLMIEWFIIYFYRKQNSKNSFHFSFMEI